jgi:glutamine amidotransferase
VSPTPPEIAVVDYGAGNLRSVSKALERSGLRPVVTRDPDALPRAGGVVLPGVGAFADAVGSLRARGLWEAVQAALGSGRPYLGLCLGLQLLFEESDEHGVNRGFGRLAGRVERFPEKAPDGSPLRVPHIGWNLVRFEGEHPMLAGLPSEDCYYFVHSYRAVSDDSRVVAGTTSYGGDFAAAVADEGVFAVQFHPEKSQWAGKRLLDAYAAWVRSA